ncbi:MAG: zinc finger protein [Circular genetic element sp.]|nr:MAG: zinc finger protein [Circular genetic element sp.]
MLFSSEQIHARRTMEKSSIQVREMHQIKMRWHLYEMPIRKVNEMTFICESCKQEFRKSEISHYHREIGLITQRASDNLCDYCFSELQKLIEHAISTDRTRPSY